MAESDYSYISAFKDALNDLPEDQIGPVVRSVISGIINCVDPASDIISDAGIVMCAYRAQAENNEEVCNILNSSDYPVPDFINEPYAQGMLDCAKMAVVRIIEHELQKNGNDLDLNSSRGLFLVVSDIVEEFSDHLYKNLPEYIEVRK